MKKNDLEWMSEVLREEDGQDVIEYALVIAFVALGAIAGVKEFSSTFNWIVNIGASIIGSI